MAKSIFCQKKLQVSDCIRLVSNPSCLWTDDCVYEAYDVIKDMCENYICKIFTGKPEEKGWEPFISTEPTMPAYAIIIIVIVVVVVLLGLIYLGYRLVERNGCDCCLDFGFARLFGRVPAAPASLYPQLEKPE